MDNGVSRFSSTLGHALGARRGDQISWSRLERKVRSWIEERVGHTTLPPPMEADDVVQNVLFEIFRRLPAFDVRSRASFHAWVIRITDHKIADLWRAIRTRKRGEGKVLSFEDQGGRPPEDIAADGPEPSTLARIAELEEHIASVLTNLSPPDREILRLREEEGLGYDEIARRLGYQKSETIRRRYFRACTKRSRLLEGLADRFRDASGGG